MSISRIGGFRIAGVASCVPPRVVDSLDFGSAYGEAEVRKVVAMAGIRRHRAVDPGVTAGDLCLDAAQRLLDRLGWTRESISGLIMVTQSPDYLLPSTSCILQSRLGLGEHCAAFDVGLGCSGYPYGLYLAACMLRGGGQSRVLVLHGETPSLFSHPDDYATRLLFGDAGTATALEVAVDAPESVFVLYTDGSGHDQLIIRGGGFRDRAPTDARDNYLRMDGAAIFNFTIKRVPQLIRETLDHAGVAAGDVDLYLFHQANRFIMKHIAKKCDLPEDRMPITLDDYGNTGGPSVPLTLTQSLAHSRTGPTRVMMLGYGVGLSWGSVLTEIDADAITLHAEFPGKGSNP